MKNLIKKAACFAILAVIASGMVSCKNTNTDSKYVFVPGGTVKGAEYTNNYDGVFPEGRTVTLSSFYMGKYEVTQSEYKSVMEGQKVTVKGTEYTLEASPSECTGTNSKYGIDYGKDHSNHPVENVTWYDAVWYCNALSTKEGLDPCYTISVTRVSYNHITGAEVSFDNTKNGYRLPTEAEWEYAARGGDQTAEDWNYVFSGADTASGTSYSDWVNSGLDSVGWYSYNNKNGTTDDIDVTDNADRSGTHEVGKKAASRLGLYDMSGNVNEWCWDWYHFIAKNETVTAPAGAASGDHRVFRGGSWFSCAGGASVSSRGFSSPSPRNGHLGFRVCRNAS